MIGFTFTRAELLEMIFAASECGPNDKYRLRRLSPRALAEEASNSFEDAESRPVFEPLGRSLYICRAA